MLGRIIALAALLLAVASADVAAYAERLPATGDILSLPKNALPARASAAVTASSAEPAASAERIKENWHPPLKWPSGFCVYAYANPTVYVDPDGRAGFLTDLRDRFDETDEILRNRAQESGTMGLLGYSAMRGLAQAGSLLPRALNLASDGVAALLPGETFSGVSTEGAREFGKTANVVGHIVTHPRQTVAAIHRRAVDTTVGVLEGDRGTSSDMITFFGQLGGGAAAGRHLTRSVQGLDAPKAQVLAEPRTHARPETTPLGRDAVVANSIEATDALVVGGRNATQRAASYEAGVRGIYGEAPLSRRTYAAPHNPSGIGRADNVADINGREIAIEAKYTDDWARSPFNPDSKLPWAAGERARMINQARNYDATFDSIIYHTNSVELANYYGRILPEAGVTNFRFVLTPATRK